jgi:diaminopimelate decarboxylase
VTRAIEAVGTPCYVTAWEPVRDAVSRLDALDVNVPIRSWLSFKTHPLPTLAERWLRAGRGMEVVSEQEMVVASGLVTDTDQILVNGVAKQAWLRRHAVPRLRVHFDSLNEMEGLLTAALTHRWRVGVRVQTPDECEPKGSRFRGQFGMSPHEAEAALRRLRAAGAVVESVHFHIGPRHAKGAYLRAIDRVIAVCDSAGFAPLFVDCGGGLPTADEGLEEALDDLSAAMRRATARFPGLREIWIENGRFITGASAALAVTVIDIKERDECRYLICDGGRTNHALAADVRPHPLLQVPQRPGPECLTTICGPTCMMDDRLGRWLLPKSIQVGDVIVWLDAGAYHLPWETRFSHGLCAVVWFDDDERPIVARAREQVPYALGHRWTA